MDIKQISSRHIGKVLFGEDVVKWMFQLTPLDTWLRILEGGRREVKDD